MEQSILKSTKKILNVDPEDTSFDLDILTHINTTFSHLHQLGIGPASGFAVVDDGAEWEDFLNPPQPVPDDYLPILSAVKTNVYLRVRALFDPPTQPHVHEAMRQQLEESDSRISMMREATAWVDPDPPVELDPIV